MTEKRRQRVLTDQELMREWLAFFGTTTGARLLGWCALTVWRIPKAERDRDGRSLLIEYGWGDRSTRYRNLERVQAFSDHLDELGVSVGEEEAGSAAAVELLGLVRPAH